MHTAHIAENQAKNHQNQNPNVAHNQPIVRRSYSSRLAQAGRLSLATFLAFGILGGTLAPAQAGPDDGKIVTTRSHVDAPKAFWENGNFTLKNEANVTGEIGDYDLEKTVNWVGKGWSGDGSGKNQYIFTVPKTKGSEFLGKPGETLYMAPAMPTFNHNPIWAGFGADTNIPVDQFRDGTFATEILSVDGPGTMELFRYNGDGRSDDFSRLLSSTDVGFHSALLDAGNHTHNYTTFSRPGRYEITYRTVARSADGSRMISSEPTTFSWQVGGQQPVTGDGTPNAQSTEDRYAQAPVGSLTDAGYTLSLSPHQGRENDGDDRLTDISFNSTSVKDGTLTLYNNGYFLTDLEVKDGKAVWPELLGSESSQIQAVFTPAGQDGARWVSQPVAYTEGGSGSVTSADGEGSWPKKIREPRNIELPTGNQDLTSGDYTATIKPTDEPGVGLVEITFKDPNFRGYLRGGLYSDDETPYADQEFFANIGDGKVQYYVGTDSWMNGTLTKLQIIPQPDMNAKAQWLKLPGTFDINGTQTGSGSLELTASTGETAPAPGGKPTPEPSTEPGSDSTAVPTTEPSAEPTAAPSVVPSQPSDKPTDDSDKCVNVFPGRTVLDHGHVDLQARLKNGDFSIGLKDDTGIIDPATTVREVDDVVLAVHNNAKHHRSGAMMNPDLDFIGEEGTEFFGLPQTQAQSIIWPGYSTENIDFSKVKGNVVLHLDPKETPDGARFGMYEDSLGGVRVLTNSEAKDSTVEIPFATHAHANWVFTQAGHYTFDAYYTATLTDGTEVKTPVQSLAFAIGDQAISDCGASPENGVADETSAEETGSEQLEQKNAEATSESGAETGAETAADTPATIDSSISKGTEDNGAQLVSNQQPLSGVSDHQVHGDSNEVPVTDASAQPGFAQKVLAHTGASAVGVALAGLLLLAGGTALVVRRRSLK